MNAQAGFLPKQAKALLDGQQKVLTYEETGGKVTAQFASHNLNLIPSIPASSIIHDNTCGSGTVTRLILSSKPPSNIVIHATDHDQAFLDVLQEDVKKNSWPVEVTNQKSENLSFPDKYFTHSITNIGIFFTTLAGVGGAKEIYRTLKPGGTAIVNCWEYVTWFAPIKAVHDVLRPGKPYPAPTINWSDGKQLQKVMVEAGFEQEKMKVEKSEAWAHPKDVTKWAELGWAFLGGIGTWQESDEERWDEAVGLLEKALREADGTKIVDGEVWMRASQWVVIATK
ncbi:S-adenosyl-L-methionine-dependent methyltransferase [Lindgomyces ingoldianus]|uniref:S-adenosyl-L-methionine-dependent methyltransferase n=1 Tax=Lindgomyces ingoldianus TaxID=673940 RepID=A0ACB6QSB2_9PLEO|nr:S-adenosyl-L-methionine-dependent methyltransferase [Lindgomyces ingoldianus]KAF2468967.1 S-adenosyl-L-methionine-dependent methyltransferase [Lindgomyces ingoldianus]